MSNDLDLLMDADPLGLSDQDIDKIIAYHRQQRANREAGGAKRASKDTGPKLDIAALLGGMVKAEPKAAPLTRRRI